MDVLPSGTREKGRIENVAETAPPVAVLAACRAFDRGGAGAKEFPPRTVSPEKWARMERKGTNSEGMKGRRIGFPSREMREFR